MTYGIRWTERPLKLKRIPKIFLRITKEDLGLIMSLVYATGMEIERGQKQEKAQEGKKKVEGKGEGEEKKVEEEKEEEKKRKRGEEEKEEEGLSWKEFLFKFQSCFDKLNHAFFLR